MRKVIATAIAIAATLVLTAAAPSKSASASSSKTVVITMGEDMKFSPAKVTIHKGQTVVWENRSQTVHNVVDIPGQSPTPGLMTLPNGATQFDSGLMPGGQKFSMQFAVPGTYKYACSLHIASGMVGQITVK